MCVRRRKGSPVGTIEAFLKHNDCERPIPHSYSSCLIHYVFSTKDRRKSITPELRERLWAYLGGIARENEMKALAIGGVEDHVHLLISLPSTISIAKAVQLLKGGSSKWVHDTFPAMNDFAWQEGYGAFSVAISSVAPTIAYIEKQETHYQTRSFEQEFMAFLERHELSFDPRHVFG